METEADTHPHSPSGKGCLSRTVSSSRVGVCRGRAGPQSGFVWAVLHYESVRSDSDGDWELGPGSWAHSWGCMTSTGGRLCRWSWPGMYKRTFFKEGFWSGLRATGKGRASRFIKAAWGWHPAGTHQLGGPYRSHAESPPSQEFHSLVCPLKNWKQVLRGNLAHECLQQRYSQ